MTMQRLRSKSSAVKIGLLILAVFYYLRPMTTSINVTAQSSLAQHLNAHVIRSVDVAKLSLRHHHPRSLAPQGETKDSTVRNVLNSLFRPLLAARFQTTDCRSSQEEWMHIRGSIAGEQRTQPMVKELLKAVHLGDLGDGFVKTNDPHPGSCVASDRLVLLMSLLDLFEKQHGSTARIDAHVQQATVSDLVYETRAVEYRNFPRWQNSTQNATTPCAPFDQDKYANKTIEDRMGDHCTPKTHVGRTWVDEFLPPHECASYPRGSTNLNRCLFVSNEISGWVIGTYIIFGTVGVCALGLILLACYRRRRRSMTPLPNDPERLRGGPPKYVPDARNIGSHGVGFDGLSARRHSDVPPYQDLGRTLDGANDGWSKWIFRRTQNEKQRRSVAPPRTVAPRLPSLKLPKPTFATVRKNNGLEPDLYPKAKSRAFGTSKQTSRFLKWGSNFERPEHSVMVE